MKKLMLAAVVLVSVALPALAKNFAVPEKNPVATLAIPDTWKTEEIEFGYSAKSPDNDIFFSAEYATGARVDAMLENNSDWLKENKITSKEKPAESEINIGGLSAKMLTVNGADENGPTVVEFVFIPAGPKRLVMLTLWGSQEERKANEADIKLIESSVKPIN